MENCDGNTKFSIENAKKITDKTDFRQEFPFVGDRFYMISLQIPPSAQRCIYRFFLRDAGNTAGLFCG